MAQRILKIYVNNQFYKEMTVDSVDGLAYDPTPVIQQIIADRDAGLLDQFNLAPGTLPIRVELSKFR